jgi:hypothetical protein
MVFPQGLFSEGGGLSSEGKACHENSPSLSKRLYFSVELFWHMSWTENRTCSRAENQALAGYATCSVCAWNGYYAELQPIVLFLLISHSNSEIFLVI